MTGCDECVKLYWVSNIELLNARLSSIRFHLQSFSCTRSLPSFPLSHAASILSVLYLLIKCNIHLYQIIPSPPILQFLLVFFSRLSPTLLLAPTQQSLVPLHCCFHLYSLLMSPLHYCFNPYSLLPHNYTLLPTVVSRIHYIFLCYSSFSHPLIITASSSIVSPLPLTVLLLPLQSSHDYTFYPRAFSSLASSPVIVSSSPFD